MTCRLCRLLAVIVIAATAAGTAASCGTPPASVDQSAAASQVAPQQTAELERFATGRSFAQLGHDRQAHFVLCAAPVCPTVTPKTLAFHAPAAAAPPVEAGQAPDSAPIAALMPGESLVLKPAGQAATTRTSSDGAAARPHRSSATRGQPPAPPGTRKPCPTCPRH